MLLVDVMAGLRLADRPVGPLQSVERSQGAVHQLLAGTVRMK